jgi:hypothetical protein
VPYSPPFKHIPIKESNTGYPTGTYQASNHIPGTRYLAKSYQPPLP